ncbi:Fe-S cluster assembly sulfur transfer protein SufU [Dichelobacter nodosus]|uniref:SUF system FeS assembly protein, NifU family n=1 Tax=Dichelobacter nodosus (strain VCS1703A) TaxID=246195 RepID=A5EYF1_DICNV|nr:SUF system NifU family Fe-S cluster assembly protein [Dichelobacter nodosus]ABQ14238.1 SUF system FeS assembly protein, NifU family [Dichelobacter nodosus VCS1703A]AXM45639.1 SUF system NifU family Fe-S cluster assembly protein [Dichelobacter nodosus]KNZ38883.1 nitrogen fixation protein NifU [Dichelobacter nodosus]TGA66875.1 SUF system NifU family Fe-S cluster assembly protein [Dichelobacter nodosus]
MNDLSDLYQELILDHSKNPRNFHALTPCTHSATGHNPLCGDNLKVFVRLNEGVIADLSFVGDGCAISKASASMMTELAMGKTLEEFQKLYDLFHYIATTQNPIPQEVGKLQALAGVRQYPARVKCATLAWHTLDAALHHKNLVKTE